jgi:hypothetical protein
VTSGWKLFVDGDPNSAWSRRYHDLAVRHTINLGGKDLLSEAQMSRVRRAAALGCELEQMEGRMSLGEQVDIASRWARYASLSCLANENAPFSPLRARLAAEAEETE